MKGDHFISLLRCFGLLSRTCFLGHSLHCLNCMLVYLPIIHAVSKTKTPATRLRGENSTILGLQNSQEANWATLECNLLLLVCLT